MKKITYILFLLAPLFSMAQTTANSGILVSASSTDLNLRVASTNTVNRLTIVNAAGATQGYVGIGIAPTEKLHINGNAMASGNLISTAGIFNVNHASNNMQFQTNGTTRMTMLSGGNVGINTASGSIAERLHVTGNTRTSGNFISDAGIFNSGTNFSLQTNGTARLTALSSNGNVGVATATPAYTFDVNGTVNATTFRVGGNQVGMWPVASSNISYTAGKVSIGTTAAPAGYDLAVGGKIVAEEVVVKLEANWPDYVFENDFKLMPLNEVQQYINANKHLPGVPSALEVKENGVAVGEMNAVLLKKIEELTLYVLELKKENEAQQKQLEELKKKH